MRWAAVASFILLAGCAAPPASLTHEPGATTNPTASPTASAGMMGLSRCVNADLEDASLFPLFAQRWPIPTGPPGLPVSDPQLDGQYGAGHWRLNEIVWHDYPERITFNLHSPTDLLEETTVYGVWSRSRHEPPKGAFLAFVANLAPQAQVPAIEAAWADITNATAPRAAAMPGPLALDGIYQDWKAGRPLPHGDWEFRVDVDWSQFNEVVDGVRISGLARQAGTIWIGFEAERLDRDITVAEAQGAWRKTWGEAGLVAPEIPIEDDPCPEPA